jgi:hypothetical protein
MTAHTFQAYRSPFRRWLGPFSPARGTRSGFRFCHGQLGAWVESLDQRVWEFWPLVASPGVRALARLVLDNWSGGRLLLLPNGLVVKPLQRNFEVGKRVLVGQCQGSVVFDKPNGRLFDLSSPGAMMPGDLWPGPRTTGLECRIQPDGSLQCIWYHPTPWGRIESFEQVRGPDTQLAVAFHKARRGIQGGRVSVTANGHVITNRQEWNGRWTSVYVGYIPLSLWPYRREWIGEEHI